MTPTNVLDAYKIPSSTSAGGKIVALVDMPDSSALADLNVYRKAFKLPELPACTGSGLPDPGGKPCFAAVEDETEQPDDDREATAPTSDGETALDVDMVSASCPDCSILLVQMTNASTTNGPTDLDFVNSAKTATRLGAVAISISFGGSEADDPKGQDYTTPGHLVLAASGDAGYLNAAFGGNTPSYPASAPDVLGVGGTTLKQATGRHL